MTAAPESPYKGLVPYTEEDADYFFGRDDQRRIITANLMAHRLTLLYGQSGVGKSSLLRAGVARDLDALAESNVEGAGSPGFAVVMLGAWRGDPLRTLAERIRRAVEPPPGQPAPGPGPDATLAEVLSYWSERLDGDILVVLDQFEEYFLYHGHEGTGPGSFPCQLAQAVNDVRVRARFLISLREDALAALDAFKGLIPRLFENYLRVEHLNAESAREAITKPLETYSREHPGQPVTIEPGLVDAVLADIQSGQVALADRGVGTAAGREGKGRDIEAPYLQLVMSRLWREEVRLKSSVLRLQTFRGLGGAVKIVGIHLDEVMRALPRTHRELAARMFRYMVTSDGAKVATTPKALADYTRIPEPNVRRTLELLAGPRVRILRESDGAYQIFHDVMAPAVLGWRQRYTAARREARLTLGGAAIALAIVAGLVWFGLRPATHRASLAHESASRAHEELVSGLLARNAESLGLRHYLPLDTTAAPRQARRGDTLAAEIHVRRPGDYVVDLVCGGMCAGAALHAYAPGDTAAVAIGSTFDRVHTRETTGAAHASSRLEMIGPPPGRYRLVFSLFCSAERCPYAYRVYRRAPLPDSASYLMTAADRGSAAVAQARRTRQPRHLRAAWSGAALAGQAAEVEALRRDGRYEESRLLNQKVCGLSMAPDRQSATVRIREQWVVMQRSVHPDSAGEPVVHPPSMQEMELRRDAEGWKISTIRFFNDPPVLC